jgi:hypothetical protein
VNVPPPFTALRVVIHLEPDRKFVAQAAAYRLAHMLSRRGHRVEVREASADRRGGLRVIAGGGR